MANIAITRGTTYSIAVQYQKNGESATLVGATVRFTMKDTEFDGDMDDSDAEILKNVTNGNSAGEATITINPNDTAQLEPGTYFYDIKVQEAGGEVYKVDEGTIQLDGSPTNRLS